MADILAVLNRRANNTLGFRVKTWLYLAAEDIHLTRDYAGPRWMRPCVYVLYRSGRPIYVGSSGNVYGRLLAHRPKLGYDSFKFKFVCDPEEHRPLEARLINRLRPIENRMIPRRVRRG